MSEDMSFATAYRKVITSFDPKANSPMTEENLPVKIMADWARYPGLAVKEGTLLNRIYKSVTEALKDTI